MKKYTKGTVLKNRYSIVKAIGEGSFGVVYLADDTAQKGKKRAIKEFTREAIPPGKEELLLRETKFLAGLSHPGLPQVVDQFFHEDSYYMVMDYIEGDTLDSLMIVMDDPFQEEDVVPWMIKLCEILEYLHGLDPPVIYRDLKPSNIILCPDGDVKLIDFGTARFFNPVKVKDTFIMGTPGFASPEQYGSEQSDARSDIYSLGATFYFLLTKKNMENAKFTFPPLRRLNPKVSPALDEIIMKCINIVPKLRFESAAELKEALKTNCSESATPPHPPHLHHQKQAAEEHEAPSQERPWLLSLPVAALVLLILNVALRPAGFPGWALFIASFIAAGAGLVLSILPVITRKDKLGKTGLIVFVASAVLWICSMIFGAAR
ncbi:MAG: protein kinase [Candidatus Eremiobacteraeota bacterium]|nr:protein kinase [Candidatus Eremiobacteraeota bacterium]